MGLPGLNVIPTEVRVTVKCTPMQRPFQESESVNETENVKENENVNANEIVTEKENENAIENEKDNIAINLVARQREIHKSQPALLRPYSQMKMKDHPNYAYNKRFWTAYRPA
ncbi:hypothetical protein EVAR_73486_1 [Eumeta japonica]|uniref:Uncharacterized protein n=1 Tax=Eumeta variegata TaxID=151549 RepID=A0A4C1TSJ2_EUMVA|nr:hypothetical protein EVAR_73486_1 [Eumeta japonica]